MRSARVFGRQIHPGGIRVLMRSRYGLALIAVRDDDMVAPANGTDVVKVKVAAFAGSAYPRRLRDVRGV